jgi:predicted Na+-dependent transporter
MDIEANITPARAVVIAGFLGSVLSLTFIDGMGKRQRVVAVISGMIMSHYLSPLIAYLFSKGEYQDTIGFLIGLFGMSIVASVFRAIQNSDIWGLLRSRYGRAGEGDSDQEGQP